uniref:RNA-directed DNA polymerase n=1 Tax=Trichogramma kaykai TaxID=54128 RepID=A0ABD2W3B8_9HYME
MEDNSDDIIDCNIGGVKLSFCIVVWDSVTESKDVLKPYATAQPLEILVKFVSTIGLSERASEIITTFYVVKHGDISILGKVSAKQLGVLKLGMSVFAVNKVTPFTKIKNVLVKLSIDPYVKPVQQPVRRVPVAVEKQVEAKLNEALQKDIIEVVTGPSAWISPIVIVFKPTGDIRICIDMRKADEAILRKNYPILTFDSFMTKLKEAKYFYCLDLKEAYHQMELHPESRPITTFITHEGLFSTEIDALRQLTKADVKFVWTQEHQNNFMKLKGCSANLPSLSYFDVSKRTRLVAHASPVALGAVLLQFDKEGNPEVISYANKSLSEVERRYSQTEKESLTLVWAVERFYFYLAGLEFELETDHKPLEAIFKPSSKPPACIERWLLRLQALRFKVIYKQGKLNIPDPFSRLCKIQNEPSFDTENEYHILRIIEQNVPQALKFSHIITESKKDEEVIDAINKISNNSWLTNDKNIFFPYRFESTYLGFVLLRGNRLIIPPSLTQQVLDLAHEGHPGETVMKRRLRSKVWWPSIDRQAENTTSVVIIKNLVEIFSRFGYPKKVRADNGPQLASSEFKHFCSINNIELIQTPPYWPQANGEVENMNRSILKRLQIAHLNGADYKAEIQKFLLMYNVTRHGTTEKSPSELLFGRNLRDKIPSISDLAVEDNDKEAKDFDIVQKQKGKEKSLVIFEKQTFLKLAEQNNFGNDFLKSIFNNNSKYICNTCIKHIHKGKIPKVAETENLKFPTIPDYVTNLSPIEERMVSPHIPFMQIKALQPYAINSQLSLQGSVVNIVTDVNEMISVLPRQFDELSVVQIKLKRHIEHQMNYIYETIKPSNVCKALTFLKDAPLYKENKIEINTDFFTHYEENNENMNFIVDEQDLQKTPNNSEENIIKQINEFTRHDNEVIDTYELNDEVLLIDNNEFSNDTQNSIVIAPGQNKQPVRWHKLKNYDELCFPKIFGGYPVDKHNILTYSERVLFEIRRKDRRSCIPTRLLFMAKKKLEKSVYSNMNICLRKLYKNENLKAENVLNTKTLHDIYRLDVEYEFLKQVRSSPSYWQEKKHLFSMIKQLGFPTLFITSSASETKNFDLLQILYNL